jgi:hypothetical protein
MFLLVFRNRTSRRMTNIGQYMLSILVRMVSLMVLMRVWVLQSITALYCFVIILYAYHCWYLYSDLSSLTGKVFCSYSKIILPYSKIIFPYSKIIFFLTQKYFSLTRKLFLLLIKSFPQVKNLFPLLANYFPYSEMISLTQKLFLPYSKIIFPLFENHFRVVLYMCVL